MKNKILYIGLCILMFLITMISVISADYITQTFEVFDSANFTCQGQVAFCGASSVAQNVTHYTGTYGVKNIVQTGGYKTSWDYTGESTSQGSSVIGSALSLNAMVYDNSQFESLSLDTFDGDGNLISIIWVEDSGCGVSGGCFRVWNKTSHTSLGSPYSDWSSNASCSAITDGYWWNITLLLNQTSTDNFNIEYYGRDINGTLLCTYGMYGISGLGILNHTAWQMGISSSSGSAKTNYWDDLVLKTIGLGTVPFFDVRVITPNGTPISNFSATINGTSFNTTNGTIVSLVKINDSYLDLFFYNIISNDSIIYANETFFNVFINETYIANVTLYVEPLDYNFFPALEKNYLNYLIVFSILALMVIMYIFSYLAGLDGVKTLTSLIIMIIGFFLLFANWGMIVALSILFLGVLLIFIPVKY